MANQATKTKATYNMKQKDDILSISQLETETLHHRNDYNEYEFKSNSRMSKIIEYQTNNDTENDENGLPIVIDHGSETIYTGYGGHDYPISIIESLSAIPSINNKGILEHAFCKCTINNISHDIIDIISKYHTKHLYIDDNEIYRLKKILTLQYPIQNGCITDFNTIEKIWHNIFYNELNIAPQEHSVFMMHSVNNHYSNTKLREQITQSTFETFNVPAMYLGIREVCSLYALGKTTGCIVHCGHEVTNAVPIYEGYVLPHGIKQCKVGGKDITLNLDKLLRKNGTILPMFIVQDIKEKLAYVTMDYNHELQKIESDVVEYILPDGAVINIGTERMQCTRVLFDNDVDEGIHKIVSNAIHKCDSDIRLDLLRNICLSGGSSMLSNLPDVLKHRLDDCYPWMEAMYYIKIGGDIRHRQFSSWIGASILSSISTFNDMWITADEYEETGPAIVHRKCT